MKNPQAAGSEDESGPAEPCQPRLAIFSNVPLAVPTRTTTRTRTKGEGALVSESAFQSAGGDKPNSVPPRSPAESTIISLAQLAPDVRLRRMRLLPGSCPPEADRPDAHSLLCLAPHGVFRAPPIARRAVGSYPAFSPLPFAPSTSSGVPGGLLFCDTFRRAGLASGAPAPSTRHAVWRCSDFPLPQPKPEQRSSATRAAKVQSAPAPVEG